jgi:hypothetical protein
MTPNRSSPSTVSLRYTDRRDAGAPEPYGLSGAITFQLDSCSPEHGSIRNNATYPRRMASTNRSRRRRGSLVPRYSVTGQLAPDGAVELVQVDLDLEAGWD